MSEIQHEFVSTPEGLRFHVAKIERDPSATRLALCLHGFPECWYSWRHQMPLLADLGYRVWAPDLRGYGESDKPLGVESYAIEKLVADVAGLIQESGANEITLLGHDWGAIVAWVFATRHPTALERLVIMNVPHPGNVSARMRNHPRQMLRSWYMLFFQLPWLPERMLTLNQGARVGEMFARTSVHPERFSRDDQAIYAANVMRPGAARAMIHWYRALLRGGKGRQDALGWPVIETPTLMIWGEQDIALLKETTYGTEEYVRDLTLEYLPDASHWVQQDVPDTVNRLLEDWLTQSR
ncbi:alpha/beta hydrolase [Myxococcota bacterium]|nr:alpha/beta hydrolase [Myxococcota bacterium]